MNYPIVFFDGDCGLCHNLIRVIIRADQKQHIFRFAPLNGETALTLLGSIESVEADSIVLWKDGKKLIKSKAAIEIARMLGGKWRCLVVFNILPTFVLDLGYDLVARNRYRWFGRPTCQIFTDNEVRFCLK